jgi:TetR/AcrR family transcriptional repressor of nem operon
MARASKIEDNRQRLLDEGVSMLKMQGYHGTGLKELLGNVSIPKGSFYNYFESKEHFCAVAIAHYLKPFIVQVDACLAVPGTDGLTAIQNYFNILINELEENGFSGGCLLGNLLGEMGDTSDPCLEELSRSVHLYRDKLKKGFERAQNEGVARNDISAETMANLIVNNWQGALLRMKVEKSTQPLKECCEHLLAGYFKA